MPRFAPLLILAQLLFLSSCSSHLHQHILYSGYVKNEVAEYDGKAPLYQVGNRVYAQGLLGTARGCGRYDHGAKSIRYCLEKDTASTVYIPLNATASREILRGETHINIEAEESLPLLTTLPKNARRLKKNHLGGIRIEKGQEHLDAHAFYALPLGAATAVCIDLPATVAMNAGAAAALIIVYPFYAPFYYFATQRENE